jgi:hypothetical protein
LRSTAIHAAFGLCLTAVVLAPVAAFADPTPTDPAGALEERIADLERRLEETERQYRQEIAALKAELAGLSGQETPIQDDEELERELAEALGGAQAPITPTTGTTGAFRLLDTSVGLLSTVGTSTANSDLLTHLQGGGHDPKRRGFTLQALGVSFVGAVDPFFNGEVHLVHLLNSDNETITGLEEAFLTTTSLPNSLEVQAGHFFLPFGRINEQHAHQWDFVDQSIINNRLFGGDGIRAPGAAVSWLSPAKWYSEFVFGVFNPRGGTMASFVAGEGHEHGAAFPDVERVDRPVKSLGDMVYLGRWLNSFELNEEQTLNVGASGLFGPNDTGETNRTQIYGLDAYWKWKPISNEKGWPFLKLQTEAMLRDYQFGETPRTNLRDWGAYMQVVWGYQRDWTAGLRWEFADGDGDTTGDPLRARRCRISPSLTWYPSSFSRLRLQYNFDDGDFFDRSEHSIWLQYEIGFGAHPAHEF